MISSTELLNQLPYFQETWNEKICHFWFPLVSTNKQAIAQPYEMGYF
jgi:hypothetical protein